MLLSQMKPVPLLFLEYPYQVEKIELRKEKRAQCSLPCKLHGKEGILPAIIEDLSCGGAKLDMTLGKDGLVSFEVDEMVILDFILFQLDKPVLLSCQIKNITAVKQRCTLGLQFSEMKMTCVSNWTSSSRRSSPGVETAVSALFSGAEADSSGRSVPVRAG